MDEQCPRRRALLEGEITFSVSGCQKPIDPFAGKVLQGGASTGGGIEGWNTQGAQPVKVIHKAGINFGSQGTEVFDTRRMSSEPALLTSCRILGARFFSSDPQT